jgi:hypothetical protein
MSVKKSLEKQMHTDRKKHVKTSTFQIEEQPNSSNAYTFNGQPINNSTEEEQVCICGQSVQINFLCSQTYYQRYIYIIPRF